MLFAIQALMPLAAGDGDFGSWGKIGWFAAVVLIGIGIWFFKGRNRSDG